MLNWSKAIVTNSYLILYPTAQIIKKFEQNPEFIELLFKALNRITAREMLDEGRVYGGGMYKIEPKELSNLPATEIKSLLDNFSNKKHFDEKLIASH